jgi:hypothetical protein
MSRILRIDAIWIDADDQVAGELSLFDASTGAHRERCRRLTEAGWLVDAYLELAERTEPLTEAEQRLLIEHTWPTLPLTAIRATLHEPIADARRQLDRIMAMQGKSTAAAQARMADLEQQWELADREERA